MTAPDLPTWTVADDADGDETLWHGDLAVLRATDIKASGGHRNALFDLLTRVLAPDEATVERLADVIHARMCGCPYGATTSAYRAARETLAALAGTSAQARHTADDATGSGVLEVERDNWIRDRAQSARVADVRDGAAAAADDGGDGAPEAEYCCDFHNRNCEPPSELCCSECTEVNHPRHTPGETCVIAGEQS